MVNHDADFWISLALGLVGMFLAALKVLQMIGVMS